jgi:hypothetical protein
MDMDVQKRRRHAVWKWECSMEMGLQHGHTVGMQHGQGSAASTGHAASTGACSMNMDVNIDYYRTSATAENFIF